MIFGRDAEEPPLAFFWLLVPPLFTTCLCSSKSILNSTAQIRIKMTSHHPTTTIIPNSLFSPLSQDYEYSMSLGEDEVQQQAQAEENEPKPSATFSFTKSRQQRDPTPQLQRYNATTTAITAVDSSIYTYTPKSLIEQVQQEVTTPAGKSREHPNNNSLIGKDVDELLAYIDNLGFAPTPQFKTETTSSAQNTTTAASTSIQEERPGRVHFLLHNTQTQTTP